MKNINSLLYKFSDMDKSSQILLFLIILVLLMLISITVINHITKKKNNKYDIDNKNIKRYSDLIKEEDKMEISEIKDNKKETKELIVNNEKKNAPEIIEKLDEEEIESLEIEEPKEEVIVTKPSSIEEISKLIENTLRFCFPSCSTCLNSSKASSSSMINRYPLPGFISIFAPLIFNKSCASSIHLRIVLLETPSPFAKNCELSGSCASSNWLII